MAYQTGSATDLDDLLSKLSTFLVANGWTEDEMDTVGGAMAFSKNSVYVSGRWDPADPQHLSLHQALGFISTATEPGDHTDDSGHGYNDTSAHTNSLLLAQRCVAYLGDGAFTSYHFFEQDSGPAYIHIVVQSSTDTYKHFGWGDLDKQGDWTGGEYCYGHYQDSLTNQSATATDSYMLFDGINNLSSTTTGRRSATMHVEGLTGQGGSDKWGTIRGTAATASTHVDGNGNTLAHLLGGFRGGPVARAWGGFQGSNEIGFIPMYPINAWHFDDPNNRLRLLGTMADVRGVHIKNFSPGQEVTVGGDTWVLFPSGKRTSDNVANRTYFQGIAYKKVTA